MVKIVHISIFNRLLNFIAHKTYYEELQNNYKTITKVKKTESFWEFSTGAMVVAGTKLPPKIFPPVGDV